MAYADPHVWNLVAKHIRDTFPTDGRKTAQRALIAGLALGFARRFHENDVGFNPRAWLDQCSPDVNRYPLSQLWEVE